MSKLTLMRTRLTIRGFRRPFAIALIAVFSLILNTSAQAATTIGELFTPNFSTCGSGTFLQTAAATGASYTVPAEGLLTSWSFETNGAVVPGLQLKVARPAGAEKYKIVGESTAGTQTASTVNTFAAHISVKAGDVIGVYEGGGGCYSSTSEAGDEYSWIATTDAALNSAETYQSLSSGRVPLSAVITFAPVAGTTPASGVGTSTATLTGSVGPEEGRLAYFQYGTSPAYGSSTLPTNVGSSMNATAFTASLNGLAPATTYHFRLVAENAAGVSYGADQTFTTNSLPVPAPKSPVLTSLRQSNTRWRVGSKIARISKKKSAPIGTTFTFNVDQQARIQFSFARQLSGRRVGNKCVAVTHANRKAKPCKRTVPAGTLALTAVAGVRSVSFQGRISASQKLSPGSYRVAVIASNAAGKSAPQSLGFTIVGG